ncbi:rhomboid family intramembrane serine protease [Limnoglobus roseus]|nr:rhomboid family intramembrane serine protease [Limnoglobus roseus]
MTADDETTIENFPPTPAIVLGWVAAAGDRAWFPAVYAQQENVPRESLDEPITALRHAGLIRVQDWVKGLGQGYGITPDGAKLVHEPQKLAKLLAEPRPSREPVAAEPPTTFDRGEEARQALFAPRPPLVVQVLIVLNVLWFLVGLALAVHEGRSGNAYLANGDPHLLHRLGAVFGLDIVRWEWWRLLSSAFVHIGALHLFMNMYALASVGSLTESIWGRRRFLLLYVAAAIGGSCLATGIKPEPLLAGASGAIWGLMASLVAWLLLHRQHLPPQVVNQSLQRLGILFVINIAVSFVPGVSWAGHFGGGIIGFVVACLFVVSKRFGLVARWVALTLTVLLTAGCVVGLTVYANRSERWAPLRLSEYHRQQVEYVRSLDVALQPIARPEVEKLYRQVMEAVRVDPTRRPDLPGEVTKLRDNAQSFADFVAGQPLPKALVTDLPEYYQNYAAAVRDLADAMAEVLRQPDGNVTVLKERKKVVDEQWAVVNVLAKLGM